MRHKNELENNKRSRELSDKKHAYNKKNPKNKTPYYIKRKRMLKKLRKKKYPYGIPEIYDLFYYLSKHIEKSLIEYKEFCTSGVPYDFVNNRKGWQDTLDTMIYAFHELGNDNPNSPMNQFYDEYPPEVSFIDDENGKRIEFKEDEERESIRKDVEKKEKLYQAEIRTGLVLFAKYYCDLWD